MTIHPTASASGTSTIDLTQSDTHKKVDQQSASVDQRCQEVVQDKIKPTRLPPPQILSLDASNVAISADANYDEKGKLLYWRVTTNNNPVLKKLVTWKCKFYPHNLKNFGNNRPEKYEAQIKKKWMFFLGIGA